MVLMDSVVEDGDFDEESPTKLNEATESGNDLDHRESLPYLA
jgi:hypothetical protein